MMACNICLEEFKEPVVTPCGHMFCYDCLVSCSQKSPDAMKAPCPICRTSFSLVSPDPAFVPAKYRPFINSNIRRVYVDNTVEVALQEKMAQLESRVQSLEKDKDLLMDKCESHMAAANSHAQRERDARMRCATLQKELKQANQCFAELVDKEAQRASVSTPAHSIYSRRSNREDGLILQSPLRRTIVSLPRKRASTLAAEYNVPALTSPGVATRPAVPLPKRRRVTRHDVQIFMGGENRM